MPRLLWTAVLSLACLLPARAATLTGLVILDGDSLTLMRGDFARWPACLGDGTAACVHSTLDYFGVDLGMPQSLGFVQTGLGGTTIQQLNARASVYQPGRIDYEVARNTGATHLLIEWSGTNCLYFGRSGADCAQDARAFVTARRIAAARMQQALTIFWMTAIPRAPQPSVDFDTFEVQRLAFNHALRMGASGADAILDVAALSPFMQDNAPETSGLYVDGTHLNEAGVRMVALWLTSRPALLAELH